VGGIQYYWKRVPREAVVDRSVEELKAMVPDWFTDEFRTESAQGIVLCAQDTGALIEQLFRLGFDDDPTAADHNPVGDPPDWYDLYYLGTYSPEHVREMAQVLSNAPLERWADQYRPHLAEYAADLMYTRPFDDEWAAAVLSDAQGLAHVFATAAGNGEAIIYRCVA
jgi:hypothetical protein